MSNNNLNKRGNPPGLVRTIGPGATVGWNLALTTAAAMGGAAITGFALSNTVMAAPLVVRAQFQHAPSLTNVEPFWIPPGYRPTKLNLRNTVSPAGGTFRAWRDIDGSRTNLLDTAVAAGLTLTAYAAAAEHSYDLSAHFRAPPSSRDFNLGEYLMLEGVGVDLGSAASTRHVNAAVFLEPIAGSTYIQSTMF